MLITDFIGAFIPILLDTSDVQSVNATVIGGSTIDIQCCFIHGSDALGCKVVLVSHCLNIRDVYATLSRSSNRSAYGRLTLPQGISCYQVFASDIDVNNIVGNLSIAGMIKQVSKCQNVRDVQVNLSRSDMFSFGQLNLTHSITCYHEVFAFEINVNNTISNLSIAGKIKPMTCGVCIQGKVYLIS